ncbi:hypothetical protein H1R20_g3630, partial [Candolleomyces eurysporus]
MEFFNDIGADPLKPSLFELVAQEQLKDLLQPALKYVLAVFAQRYPRYLLRLVNRHEEFYALIMLVVERHYLTKHNASFSENFYGLKRRRRPYIETERTKAAVGQVPAGDKLRSSEVWKSLVFLIGIPYVRAKMQDYFEELGGGISSDVMEESMDTRQIQMLTDQSLRGRFRRAFKRLYPWLNMSFEGWLLIYNISYLFNQTPAYRPWLNWIGVDLRRLGIEDFFGKRIQAQQIPGWSTYYLDYKFLKKIISSLAANRPASEAAALALGQFVEINAEGFRKILKKYDKRSTSTTKELYLARQVDVQPVFNRQLISELANTVATCLLDITDLSSGLNFEGPNANDIFTQQLLTERPSLGPFGDLESGFYKAIAAGDSAAIKDCVQSTDVLRQQNESNGNLTRMLWNVIIEAPPSFADLILTSLSPPFDYHFVDDINGRTCLHGAAIAGAQRLVDLCLQNGVPIDKPDLYGRTALHYAAMKGHAEVCRQLLKAHVPPNSLDRDNYSPLVYATVKGNVSCVRVLLEEGGVSAQSPTASGDLSPLSLAAEAGHVEVVALLLEHKAASLPNTNGEYPMHLAAQRGHVDVCRLLLSIEGWDKPDKYHEWTPLFHAARHGHVECVDFQISVVQPFEGVTLEVGGDVETYWKSTEITSVASFGSSGQMHRLDIPSSSNTSPAFMISRSGGLPLTQSSLYGSYLHVVVQVTRDLHPVVYSDWLLPGTASELGVADVTLEQFEALARTSGGFCDLTPASGRDYAQLLPTCMVSLEYLLMTIPTSYDVVLELAYPAAGTIDQLNLGRRLNLNAFVDSVLRAKYGVSAAAIGTESRRKVAFLSFSPDVCAALNWKQPNYPVFFASSCGNDSFGDDADDGSSSNPTSKTARGSAGDDLRTCSIGSAVEFAKSNNLLGVFIDAELLVSFV